MFLLIWTPVLWADRLSFAGTSLSSLSEATSIITVKNAKELSRIVKLIEEAKKDSKLVLSREEIEKIRQKAEQVLQDEANTPNEEAGASVYCGSQIIN